MKIIEYKIVNHHSQNTLPMMINEDIKNGWQPLGGIYFESIQGDRYYSQAMVKYEDAPSQNDFLIKDLISRIKKLEKLFVSKIDRSGYDEVKSWPNAIDEAIKSNSQSRQTLGGCPRCSTVTKLHIEHIADGKIKSTCTICGYLVREWKPIKCSHCKDEGFVRIEPIPGMYMMALCICGEEVKESE